ncbi:MAG: T9SS type A sorting domain-containing protein [Chitinophagaceae bacterium]
MKPISKSLFLILLLTPALSFSQSVINVYARVTAVSGTSLTITGATGSFTAGQAIIMQMQDSTIGTNTGNNTGFGNLGSIQSAGISEVVNISAATSTIITLSTALINTYHINNNSRVQIISYPTLGGGGNYTLNGGVTAPLWNGSTGGVVAFTVTGNLTLNSDIKVDGLGFRGGAAGNNAPADYTCDPNTFYDNAAGVSTTYYGYKGEGIHNTNGVYTVARGRMLNGGGGGNLNNAGGGGGGNLTAGGAGGQGWSCSASTTGGGMDGVDLSNYVSGNRFFFGGGGGGGQQNNSVGTAGGNGGGIILIKANSIKTTGGCNSGAGYVSISAKGNSVADAGNDGAGGGGAGGAVILQVSSYVLNNGCPLNINTSGGDGGDVNNSGAHGGGGGGGKGVVVLSGVVGIPAYVSIADIAGTGGANDNTPGAVTANPGSSAALSGASGIIFTPSSVLPVLLSGFEVSPVKNTALLQWQASVENGFSYYQVERSVNNGIGYAVAGKVAAKGNNGVYSFTDDVSTLNLNGAKIYYRLKMVDLNGNFEYSAVKVALFNRQGNTITIKSFPNPVTATVYVTSGSITNITAVQAIIHDMQGRTVKTFSNVPVVASNTIGISFEGITKGQYIITIKGTNGEEHTVVTKQ